MRKVGDTEPLSLYVFKTVSDPFSGRISYFKVFPACSRTMPRVQNFTRSSGGKVRAHLDHAGQDRRFRSTNLHAGDIGAVAKLKDTLTGDTLGDKGAPIQYPAGQASRAGHHLRH